jgi:hypothetical protein
MYNVRLSFWRVAYGGLQLQIGEKPEDSFIRNRPSCVILLSQNWKLVIQQLKFKEESLRDAAEIRSANQFHLRSVERYADANKTTTFVYGPFGVGMGLRGR